MSKKSRKQPVNKKIYPKTNISRAYYKRLVNNIEHDPLIKHSTVTIAGMIAAISILLGSLIWYAQFNPGNLIYTNAKVITVSNGRTDSNSSQTRDFVTFEFNTKGNDSKTYKVRQIANVGLSYKEGQIIKIGYHPKNPNFARNLSDTRPPYISIALWSVPFFILLWFMFVALIRYAKRQELIWAAAEAADSED